MHLCSGACGFYYRVGRCVPLWGAMSLSLLVQIYTCFIELEIKGWFFFFTYVTLSVVVSYHFKDVLLKYNNRIKELKEMLISLNFPFVRQNSDVKIFLAKDK